MKEINAINKKNREHKAIYRIEREKIYIKYAQMQYGQQIMKNLESLGCKVAIGQNKWILATLPFEEYSELILGDYKIDTDIDTPAAATEKIALFFKDALEKAGFEVTITEL